MNGKQWLTTAIAHLDWINCGEPYWEQDYADFKIERAAGLSTNMLFFAVHHGGYSIYPTDLAPIAPKLDDDLLARLVDGTHRRGMKFAAYVR